ncbi:MAG: hypothetical protein OXO49_09170 [Gammaproteobacteria bacterium]|nr:hypothetical protein [Gammaproteobacteria bacterium]MDE0252751.1 hypothetical protein [Gammaproteobacteria bacterium]MDE0402233.1 hypothetical protein [Gammaproteobacteria bacterium]MDE0644714.1 hypothetical protein [Gammaproteobacteria bacterium]
MIKYLKRFWSECFDGDVPTPYARLHIYKITLFSGVICSIVAISIINFGSIFSSQLDPLVFVLLLIGIGNTVFGTLLLKGLRSKYSDSDFEPNKT